MGKVTTRIWPKGTYGPPLYDVLIDGKPIGREQGRSDGRVLRMTGNLYVMVLDGCNDVRLMRGCTSRREAAEGVAQIAADNGLV